MNNFWRLPATSSEDVERMLNEGNLIAPEELFQKLRPKHGILLANWDESELIGSVLAFGVVKFQNIVQSWLGDHLMSP